MSFTWQDDPIGASAAAAADAPAAGVDADTSPPAGHELTLGEVTSVIVIAIRKQRVHTGTLAELERAHRAALLHNLLLGWWAIPFGVIWTPIWIARNRRALRELRGRAGGVSAPGRIGAAAPSA